MQKKWSLHPASSIAQLGHVIEEGHSQSDIRLFIVHSLFHLCCTDGNTTHQYMSIEAQQIITNKDSLPFIGNCYAYEFKKDTVIGLILAAISVEDDTTYYSFLLSGRLFPGIPSMSVFHQAGIAGLAVPSGYTGGSEKTLCRYSIKEKDLLQYLDKLVLIDKIANVSNKNVFGTHAVLQQPGELVQEYSLFEKRNEDAKEQMKEFQLPVSLYQVVGWESLLIADNASDIAQPATIWILSPKTAHPLAAKLMTDSWFWEPADDWSPFGNDDGSDAFYIFKDWRKDNPDAEPATLLDVLEKKWAMSFSHKNMLSENELEAYEKTNQYYRNIDMAIIGTAFGQLVLEGTVSKQLKEYGIKAIQRTILPIGIKDVEEENKIEFQKRLSIMYKILNGL